MTIAISGQVTAAFLKDDEYHVFCPACAAVHTYPANGHIVSCLNDETFALDLVPVFGSMPDEAGQLSALADVMRLRIREIEDLPQLQRDACASIRGARLELRTYLREARRFNAEFVLAFRAGREALCRTE